MTGSTDESPGPGHYRFGDVVVDRAAHAVSRAGVSVALEPKAFAVLLALLERPGVLVSRDDLLDRVWGHRHVTPGVLTRAIAQLRGALGDDPQDPRYIQTRHALGYCFVGTLVDEDASMVDAGEEGGAPPAESPEVAVAAASEQVLVAAVDDASLPVERDRASSHAWRPRHWLLASLLAIVVFAMSFWGMRNDPPALSEASVAVLPFTNLGNDRDQDYFAQGLAVEMHDALASIDGLSVAAQMSPSTAAASGEDVHALGRRLGVASVLDASVRREGERVRINARLTDTASGYTLWSRSYERELSDVFAVQTEIATEVVRSLMGVIPGGRDAIERRLTPTRSVLAFDWYLRGVQKLRESRDEGDAKQAVSSFESALEADEGLAAAHLGICRVELWRFNNLRDGAALDRAEDACKRGAAVDAGSRLADLLIGDIHRYRGEADEARQRYASALESHALQADVHVRYGAMLSAEGKAEEAIAEFTRARGLRPGDAKIASMVGFQQFRAGRAHDAIESFLDATRLRPDDGEYWSSLGGLYVSVDEPEKAMAAFERALTIAPSELVYYNRATLLFQQGDYRAAAESARQALDIEDSSFETWGLLADSLAAAGGADASARAAYVRASTMARAYLDNRSDDAVAQAAQGWFLAALGELAEARRWAEQAESSAPRDGTVALLNAQTLAHAGTKEEVATRLQKARANGIEAVRIRNNPFIGGNADAMDDRDPP